MKGRANRIDFRGIVEHRHEADGLLTQAGAAVLVRRGVERSFTMTCPDGCGEVLTVNLDRRSGPAWRFYLEEDSVSLYPSVWRHTGCESHFIVWRSRIYWCDWGEEFVATSTEFEQLVLGKLTGQLQACSDIAEQLDAVPWAVLSACQRLRRRGLVQSGPGEQRSLFRLPDKRT
jgi:hypothetical protein